MKEQILHDAIEEFNQIGGIQCKVLNTEIPFGDKRIDAQLLFTNNKQQWTCYAEIKHKIVPAQIPAIQNQMKELGPYIVVADYITNPAKEILKENNVGYIDTIRNAYVNFDGLYVYVETNKTNRQKITVGNRAFNKAGIKVVYQFLIHPKYLNKPYRFIAKQAKVTIDTVGKVIQDLLKEKYIIQVRNREYQFDDRKKLFEDWTTAFNKNLRPKLVQKTYRFLDKGFDWKKVVLPPDTCWGGAIAAEQLTDYLIADKGIIYTDKKFIELMKHLKLVPDKNGNLTLIEKFWNNEEKQPTHPMLVYADLMNDFNPRYFETANKIYVDYVQTYL